MGQIEALPKFSAAAFLAALTGIPEGLTSAEMADVFGFRTKLERQRVFDAANQLLAKKAIVKAGKRKIDGRSVTIYKVAPQHEGDAAHGRPAELPLPKPRPPRRAPVAEATAAPPSSTLTVVPERVPEILAVAQVEPEPLCCPTCRRGISPDDALAMMREGVLQFAPDQDDEEDDEEGGAE